MSEPPANTDLELALLACFVEEAREHMQTFSDGLLRLEEGTGCAEVINGIFRAVHTIKGCARTLGCTDIGKLSHAGENLLDALRKQTVAPDGQVTEALFATCDALNLLLADVETRQPQGLHDEVIDPLVDRLNSLLGAPPRGGSTAPALPADWPAPGVGLSRELVSEFVVESADHVAAMESALLELEKAPAHHDRLNSVFRAIHSIKGTADYVGLAQIKTLSHHLESVLDLLRKGDLALDAELSDIVFEAADTLKNLIRNLGPDCERGADLRPLVARLKARSDGTAAGGVPAATASPHRPVDPRLDVFVRSATQQVESVRSCSRKIAAGDTTDSVVGALHRAAGTLISAANYVERGEFLAPAEGILDIAELFREGRLEFDETILLVLEGQVAALAECLAQVQAEARTAQPAVRLGDILCANHVAEREEIEAAAQAPMRIGDRVVAQGLASREQVELAAAAQTGAAPPAGGLVARTMRVDQGKLDEYLNLAGELLVARNELAHVAQLLTQDRGALVRRLKDAVDGVARVARDIQDNAMSMRMVPVRNVFQRFPRMIRDIAKTQGKQITLQMLGEDTEIDKQVAEALGDPLVHLIRNAADHGIEPPDERVAAGKPATGAVTLRASREGNHILIDLCDDGAGIRVDRLKAKAVEAGIVTAEQAETMARADALQLIFAPGLSTARAVSDISGRGVGMDVVRSNIAALGGSVAVASEEGRGAQLRIRLPLTLAVSNVVLVGCSDETFALPMEAVAETVKIDPRDVTRMKDDYLITLRGRVLAALPLARLFSLGRREPGAAPAGCGELRPDATGKIPIVVLSVGGLRYGLIVDAFLGQQEIVVKPLPSYLAGLPGLGGATILGEGTIVLVLDPLRLGELAPQAEPQPAPAEAQPVRD